MDGMAAPDHAEVLNVVLDHTSQGMVVVGSNYRILAFNRGILEMFKFPAGLIEVGTDFRKVIRTWARETGQDRDMLDRALRDLDEPSRFEFEFSQSIKGETRWCLLIHDPLPNGRGFVRTFTDITRYKALEADLTKMSREDALTGLLNRRTILDALHEEAIRFQRYQRPLSLLMIDIDHFKHINDRWGHLVGDEVLRVFAGECRRAMRENDKVGRWGGEEFVMLLPETDGGEAEVVAERLRRLVSETILDTRVGEMVQFTVSIGVASAGVGDAFENLLSHADRALYAAKADGRNRIVRALPFEGSLPSL
jgi:diguanylate cyclase (GGDEF)-like protein/PAS domain S-box-containing protein